MDIAGRRELYIAASAGADEKPTSKSTVAGLVELPTDRLITAEDLSRFLWVKLQTV